MPIPEETNPADFFLETINIDFEVSLPFCSSLIRLTNEENRAAALEGIKLISDKHLETNYMIHLGESIDDSKEEAKKSTTVLGSRLTR